MKNPRSAVFLSLLAGLICLFLATSLQWLADRRMEETERLSTALASALESEDLDPTAIEPLVQAFLEHSPRAFVQMARDHARIAVDPERRSAHWVYSSGQNPSRAGSGIYSIEILDPGVSHSHSGFPHTIDATSVRLDRDRLIMRFKTQGRDRVVKMMRDDLDTDRSYDAVFPLEVSSKQSFRLDETVRVIEVAN